MQSWQNIIQRRFHSRLVLIVCGVVCATSSYAAAQGPGGGGGGGGAAAPAFNDPKFRDRVWEAGGPRLSGLHTGKLVKAVVIKGNETVSQHKILSHMQTRVDRNYDERQLQSDIHALYGTELFRTITPKFIDYKDGVVVELLVVENPTVTEVVFHGNTRLDESMLSKHCGIKVGDPANPFSVDMARQRLVDLYLEKGLNQVAIEVREGNRKDDRRVFFDIYEGPVERVWDIKLIGNSVFSTSLLKTKIRSKDARGGATPYMGNVANWEKFDNDKTILVAYYRSLGYFQAKVDYFYDYYDDGNFLDLTFVISEGQQYKVRNVTIVGNHYEPFTTEVLMAALETKAGDAFNLGRMSRDQRKLRNDYYGREGFVFVDIVPEPRFLDEPGMLDLVFKINEGDRYRAGEINVHIEGDSSHTAHNVVLNMMGIREGQFIDLKELEDSERRLKASQIFESNPAMGEPPRIEVRPPDAQDLEEF
ncbi:BamA/OMP85 family outer membrane protein [Aureliella helgolandensis]|uniref:Outer membrane protein assembly factor BamA n=1 Tax=Aureliella helgolandensis TaxID=2527968 RepID=A0A518G5R2_9BACT|nr:POTRA domain-containing protein [Aureliella helgolandensis]QDV23928.1 Outer membrane protein assembly factor BamA precursor [Aureliella helgolandensis]